MSEKIPTWCYRSKDVCYGQDKTEQKVENLNEFLAWFLNLKKSWKYPTFLKMPLQTLLKTNYLEDYIHKGLDRIANYLAIDDNYYKAWKKN